MTKELDARLVPFETKNKYVLDWSPSTKGLNVTCVVSCTFHRMSYKPQTWAVMRNKRNKRYFVIVNWVEMGSIKELVEEYDSEKEAINRMIERVSHIMDGQL